MSALCNASKEVLEAVLLFLGQQYRHLSPASSRKLEPRANVSIFTDEGAHCQGDVTWHVKVEASGLGAYYLDGSAFLTKLCEQGEALRGAVTRQKTGRREVIAFSRRIGDYSTVQCHIALLLPSADSDRGAFSGLTVEESVLSRPPDFPPAGLRVCFQAGCSMGSVGKEADMLSTHMHLLHLINPEFELGLSVRTSSQILVSSQFTREPGWSPTSSSPYRLITSIHHYTSAATKQTKLHLTRGLCYALLPLTRRNGSCLSLKLYCAAAVVPHISLRSGRKIPANRTCRQLNVSVFGPGSLPVVSCASLSSLADWDSYGLSLSQSVVQHASEGAAVASCRYLLSDSRPASMLPQNQPKRKSRVSCNHTLTLFLFLEDSDALRGPGHCTTSHWGQQMERVHELRGMLDGLVHSQQKKFKQATHSALNKLLCNYGTHIKTASVMHTALPLLADAVASIVSHSTNDHFKQKCRSILNVEEEASVQERVSEKLWELAETKLHISETRTIFPHEPLSPELEHAVSEGSLPAHHTTAETPTTTNSRVQSSATAELNSTSSKPEVVSTVNARPTTASNSRDTQQNSQSTDSKSYSLFQAMIYSKRVKRCGIHQAAAPSTASLQLSPPPPGEQGGGDQEGTGEQGGDVDEQRDAGGGSTPVEHSGGERSSFDTLTEFEMEVAEDSATQMEENSVSFLGFTTSDSTSTQRRPTILASSTAPAERDGDSLLTAERDGDSLLTAERDGDSLLTVERDGDSLLTVERDGDSLLTVERDGDSLLTAERYGDSLLTAEHDGDSLLTAERDGDSLLTAMEDASFEELGAVDTEECTRFESMSPVRANNTIETSQEETGSGGLSGDGDVVPGTAASEMEWGVELDEDEFGEMEDEFSDFPTSENADSSVSECDEETEEVEQEEWWTHDPVREPSLWSRISPVTSQANQSPQSELPLTASGGGGGGRIGCCSDEEWTETDLGETTCHPEPYSVPDSVSFLNPNMGPGLGQVDHAGSFQSFSQLTVSHDTDQTTCGATALNTALPETGCTSPCPSDEDWMQWGQLKAVDESGTNPSVELLQASGVNSQKLNVLELPLVQGDLACGDDSPRATPTVPDSNNISFDIGEEDFHWD